jgi:hypothetical protein
VRLFSGTGAHVVYEYDVPAEQVAAFKEAVSQVGVVGRAMDMVITRVSHALPSGNFDVFEPCAINGRGMQVRLNTPVPGFIESVLKRYRRQGTLLTVESKREKGCCECNIRPWQRAGDDSPDSYARL